MTKPKVDGIFEITLSNSKRAFAQFLHFGKMGPIIQVFDLISMSESTLDSVLASKPLFPPIITGLFAAIRGGFWKVIGNRPVASFTQPRFVTAAYDERTGEAKRWSV